LLRVPGSDEAKVLFDQNPVGLAAGIFTGLFLGERAVVLKWAADGFVKLLQMTVLPYVIVSIVSSLGRLRYDEVRALGRRIAAVVGVLWLVALTFALLIAATFPGCRTRRSSARHSSSAGMPSTSSTSTYRRLLELVPNSTLVPQKDMRAILETRMAGVDAVAMPAERGSASTLLYPEFSVVVPEPGSLKLPLAYPIARHDQAFATFVNTWIGLKRKDGTLDAAYRYWILGQNAEPQSPRWSIIRNVLHLVK